MQIIWMALLQEVTSLNLNKEAFVLLNGVRSNAGSSQIHALSRHLKRMFNFSFTDQKLLPTSRFAELLACRTLLFTCAWEHAVYNFFHEHDKKKSSSRDHVQSFDRRLSIRDKRVNVPLVPATFPSSFISLTRMNTHLPPLSFPNIRRVLCKYCLHC